MKKNNVWKAALKKFALCCFTALLLLLEVISGTIPSIPGDADETAVILDDKKPEPDNDETNLN